MNTLIKIRVLKLGFLDLLNLHQCFSNCTLVDHYINLVLWASISFIKME